MIKEEIFIDIESLSKKLQIPKSTIYKMTSGKKIPFYKFNKKLMFSVKDIKQWIKLKKIA